jgi:diguanylate cyclase (GGDEF)-like protein
VVFKIYGEAFSYPEAGEYLLMNISQQFHYLLDRKVVKLSTLSDFNEFDVEDRGEKRYYRVVSSQSSNFDGAMIFTIDITDWMDSIDLYNIQLAVSLIILLFIIYIFNRFNWSFFVREIRQHTLNADEVSSFNRSIERLFEHGDSMIIQVENSGEYKILFFTESIKDITGFIERENLKELFYNDLEFDKFKGELEYIISKGRFRAEISSIKFSSREGSPVYVDLSIFLHREKEKRVEKVLINVINATSRDTVNARFENLKERFDFLKKSTEANFWEIDLIEKRKYLSISKESFKREVREQLLSTFHNLSIPDIDSFEITFNSVEQFYQLFSKKISQNRESEEFSFRVDIVNGVEDENHFIEVFGKKIFVNEKLVRVIGVSREVKKEKKMEVSSIDSLHSKEEIERILEREVERSRRYKNPLSIVFFEIDDFDNIEEREGRESGEKLILDLINGLLSLKRSTDILGKWSKTEFIFVAFETDLKNAEIFANKLRNMVGDISSQNEIKFSCSFGIEEFSMRYDNNVLIYRGHKALLSAKNSGGDRVAKFSEE